MKKKLVTKQLQEFVKDMVPTAGTDEPSRKIQVELSKVLYEIGVNGKKGEKDQLREAFYKGVTYGMLHRDLYPQSHHDFEQYYRENYEDDTK